MEEKFSVFQSFIQKEDAAELARRLEAEGIPFVLEDNNVSVDVTFAFDHSRDEYRIRIPQHLFANAHKILEEQAKEEAGLVPEEHFLHSFENEELFDVLKAPDEWSKTDYVFAQELLVYRGETVDQEQLERWKVERMDTLRQPEDGGSTSIALGYMGALGSLIVGPILGGIGVFIGGHLMKTNKTLPSGEVVPTYNEATRKSGKSIFRLSLIGMGIWLILAILAQTFVGGIFF